MRCLILLALVGACAAQFGASQFRCQWYSRRDCDKEREHSECGSDGITYRNRCEFTQAVCAGNKIDVLYYDKCDGRTHNGGPAITGEQAVLDYFCVELAHESCYNDAEQLCGSDGKTYQNLCEYEKAKCTHRHLTVTSFTACPATST